MFVSEVHPIIILRALFWVIYSLFRLVSDIMADQMVLPYSNMGLVMAVKVVVTVSFWSPHDAEVRAFIIFMDLSALSFVDLICSLKFSFGSKITSKMLGLEIIDL